MRLRDLTRGIVDTTETADPEILGVTADRRRPRQTSPSTAPAGAKADGGSYAASAVARGAVALLAGSGTDLGDVDVPVVRVADPRKALALVAARFYGEQPATIVARRFDAQGAPRGAVLIAGESGAGKSTIFRMIVGDESPDAGEVSVPKRATIGYFRHDIEGMSGRQVLDEAIAGSGRLGDLHHELIDLERAPARCCMVWGLPMRSSTATSARCRAA